MQITETLNEGLKREFNVVVPAATLEQNMMARLNELSKTANIKGFRPGKVPTHHLRKVYGPSVMAEVVEKTLEETAQQAVVEKELKPAYQPEIKLSEDKDEVQQIIDGKADLAFSMSFEVVPAFEIEDFSGLKVERMVVDVTDEHINEALERIAEQYKDYADKGAGAKAETGDRATISFVGKVDGEVFDGGTAEDVPLELGAGQFIPGFEEQVTGAKAGDEITVNVTFPADYNAEHLAGKDAVFDVKLLKVEQSKDSVIDDDFAKKLGLDDLAKLKEMVSERIADEFGEMSTAKLKRDMLDELDSKYTFELPEKLVSAEFDQIWQALSREMEQEKKTFEDEGTTEDDARKEYQEISERRVRLGLVLGTIGEKAEVTISEEELQRALVERARQFSGQEKQVYDFYRNNPQAMMELRGPIFEQKVVEHIAENAKLAEKKVTREELQHALEHDHDHGDEKKSAKPAKKAPAKKAAAKKTAAKKAAKK